MCCFSRINTNTHTHTIMANVHTIKVSIINILIYTSAQLLMWKSETGLGLLHTAQQEHQQKHQTNSCWSYNERHVVVTIQIWREMDFWRRMKRSDWVFPLFCSLFTVSLPTADRQSLSLLLTWWDPKTSQSKWWVLGFVCHIGWEIV